MQKVLVKSDRTRFWMEIALTIACAMICWHLNRENAKETIRTRCEDLRVGLMEVESGQRGFLLTGNDLYLESYRFYRSVLPSRVTRLCSSLAKTDENTADCAILQKTVKDKLDELALTIAAFRNGDAEKALLVVRTDRGLHYTQLIEHSLNGIRLRNADGDGYLALE